MNKRNIFLLINIFFILSGCALFRDLTKSMDEPYRIGRVIEKYKGKITDGKDNFFSTEITIKKDIKGKKWAEITSPLLYAGIVSADVSSDENSNISLYINSFRYIATWNNGWTSGENEASGEITLTKNENNLAVNIKEPFELWDVTKGGVRYYDDYYVYENGERKVKERTERIKACVNLLKEQKYSPMPEYFRNLFLKLNGEESFRKKTQILLFPETLLINKQYKEKKLPEVYTMPESIKGDIYLAEGFPWRKSYSKAVFPENMREIRDKGSLWRDYEEAGGLFIVFYNMDYYFNKILPNTIFVKSK
jgi:hypothetical protein